MSNPIIKTYKFNYLKRLSLIFALQLGGFVSFELNAQTSEIDSLENLLRQYTIKDTIRVNLLNKTAYKIYLKNFDKTLEYAEEAYQLANKLNFTKGKAESFRYIGIHYYMKANYSKALEYYQKALTLEEELGNKRGISRCCNNIGMIYRYQSDFPKSLEYLQKALKIGKEFGDKLGISLSFNNIGNTYRSMDNYPKALDYYQKALKLKIQLGNKRGIAGTYHNIGKNYKFQGNYPKALESLQKSLKICIDIGDKSVEARNYTELGSVYLKQNKIKEAYSYSKKAYTLAKKIGEMEFMKESSKILAKSCKALGLYEEAYEFHVIFKTINDSLYNEKNTKEIAGLEFKYKYEKEKQATELKQQKKDAILLEEAKRQELVRNSFIVGFIFMLIVVVLVLRSFFQKQKANNVLYAQKVEIQAQAEELETANNKLHELNATKDKFFSIIAHDLKSPFNALLGFSDLLLKNHQNYDEKEREKYLKIINNSSIKTYNLLENLLTWSQSQTGKIEFLPVKINVKVLIDEVILLMAEAAENKNIKLSSDIKNPLLVYADKNMIDTVLRNLISNAIKFTKTNGKVSISSKLIDKNIVYINVVDTGVGINKQQIGKLFNIEEQITTEGTNNEKGTGLGLILCKEFIDKHNNKIWVESETGKGSSFMFTLTLV